MIYIAKAMNPLYIHTICLGRTSKFRKEALRFFHFIGNFNEIPYEIKNGNINDESGKSINKTIGSDRFE